ncbi:MAG TPA: DsrE family protein [Chitinophagaceae bacterium]|nr:DsrE family protein [Chitinophagaceae bacterium]
MKKQLLLIGFFFAVINFVQAQKDYKVVFDLTSKDTLDQQALLRWTREVSNASSEAQVEVVMYGKGVNLVAKDRTQYGDAVSKLLSNKNISFKACAVALKAQGIDKSQLLPGVEVVPDGIYEIISKQRQGWGYIKAVH